MMSLFAYLIILTESPIQEILKMANLLARQLRNQGMRTKELVNCYFRHLVLKSFIFKYYNIDIKLLHKDDNCNNMYSFNK